MSDVDLKPNYYALFIAIVGEKSVTQSMKDMFEEREDRTPKKKQRQWTDTDRAELIRLREELGYSTQEIANVYGISKQSVNVQIFKYRNGVHDNENQ